MTYGDSFSKDKKHWKNYLHRSYKLYKRTFKSCKKDSDSSKRYVWCQVRKGTYMHQFVKQHKDYNITHRDGRRFVCKLNKMQYLELYFNASVTDIQIFDDIEIISPPCFLFTTE